MKLFLRCLHRLMAIGVVVAASQVMPSLAEAQTCTGTDPGGKSATQGLYAEYFAGYYNDDQRFFDGNSPGLVRLDAQLNFAATNRWGNLMPPATGTSENPDAYSARYQGSLLITKAGSYTITLTSDDAAYLWLDAPARRLTPINSEATISNGLLHGATTVSATVTLTAGNHDLLLDYGDRDRFNVLVMEYSGPDTDNASVVVPSSALCTHTGRTQVVTASATPQAQFAAQVYPNPAVLMGAMRVRVQQDTAAPVQLTLYDVQGRLMQRKDLSAAANIDQLLSFSSLSSAGVYLVRLTSSSGTTIQKLVVQ